MDISLAPQTLLRWTDPDTALGFYRSHTRADSQLRYTSAFRRRGSDNCEITAERAKRPRSN